MKPAPPGPDSPAGVTDPRRTLGARGEELAARWYQQRGYRILERNWRCRDGEIDLVVRGDDCIVFCEVKARTSDRFGSGTESVPPAKQRRIRRLAASWFAGSGRSRKKTGGCAEGVRFDVVSITSGRLEVVEGAF